MGSFSLCLLLSTLAVVASYVLLPTNHPPGVIHVGDGKTRQFTNTVTTDGKTRSQTVSYTDNSVVANGIIHSGQGTINIAQENIPNQKQWRSSEPKDLNSRGTGVKGKRDTLAVTYKDQSIYVHSAQIDGSGVINIGNGRRSKRSEDSELRHKRKDGIWDVDNDWSQRDSNRMSQPVVSNFDYLRGSGSINIGHNDRSKRSDDAQLRYKRKGGFWDIGVDTNTDFRHTWNTWKYQPVYANDNYHYSNGNIVIGNGDRSKRSTENLRQKRAFDGSLAIHDMRTKPGPPVNIENIHGRGSAHIVIDDNTDPITLEGAKIHGSAMINIGG